MKKIIALILILFAGAAFAFSADKSDKKNEETKKESAAEEKGKNAREKTEKGLNKAGKAIEKGGKKAAGWLEGFFGESEDEKSE